MKYDELYTALTSLLAAGSQFDTLRRKENKNVTALVRVCVVVLAVVRNNRFSNLFSSKVFNRSVLDGGQSSEEVKNSMANGSNYGGGSCRRSV